MAGEIGVVDRVIRLLLVPAAIIAATAFAPDNAWAAAGALLFSAYMIAVVLVGKCPLYMLLGIHTTGRHAAPQTGELPKAA